MSHLPDCPSEHAFYVAVEVIERETLRLQSRCCASTDALTVAGLPDRLRATASSAMTVSVIVFFSCGAATRWLVSAFGGIADGAANAAG